MDLDERLKAMLLNKTFEERARLLVVAARIHSAMPLGRKRDLRAYNRIKQKEYRERMFTKLQEADGIKPNTDMVGECKVCGSTIIAKRQQCRRGHLDMLYYTCSTCKEISPSKTGGAVEMRVQPHGPVRKS